MVAGAQVASASIRKVGNAATRVGQVSAKAGERIGQVGGRAGQKFGRDMAAGVRASVPQFNRAIDQAARDAQRRLSAIRPSPIRMPAVQQAGVPRAAGMPAPVGAFTSPEGRLRDSRGRYIVGGVRAGDARRSGAGAGAGAGRVDDRGMDAGGMGRLWSLQALGGQARQGVDAARQQADQSLGVASERLTARAEMRTVVSDPRDRLMVREAARESALGRGGMVVPIDETAFTNAVFGGVASGLSAARATELVPVASNLALAGQSTPQAAQIGLTQLAEFHDLPFKQLGDMIAKAQDMFAFPGGLTEVTGGFRSAGAAAQMVGMSLEDQLITQGVFANVGRRGEEGGTATRIFTASLAQGFERLNMDLIRRPDGTLDVGANLRAVQALDLDFNEMNKIFTRRGGTAITQQISGLDSHDRGLGDYSGTALENAREHAETWESTLQELAAAQDVVNATMGLGVMKVRSVDAALMKFFARTLADAPGLATGAGVALEVGSRVGQLGVGALDAMVGIHAFKQLAHGTLNPANLFRSEATVDQRRTARGRRGLTRGIDGQARRWRGLFGTMSRGVTRSRGGFRGMFGLVARGAVRLGGMVAAELAGALAGRAVAGVAGGALTKAAPAVAGAVGAAGAARMATAISLVKVVGPIAIAAASIGLLVAVMRSKRAQEKDDELQKARDDAEVARRERESAGIKAPLGERIGMALGAPGRFVARLTGLGAETIPGDLGGPSVTPASDQTVTPPAPVATIAAAQTVSADATQAGAAIPTTMAAGVEQTKPLLVEAIGFAFRAIIPWMAQSDAEVGPLSNLTAHGMAIPATLAAGVTEGSPVLQAAITEMLANVGLPAITAPGMLAPAAPEVPDLLAPGIPAVTLPDPLVPAAPEIPALAPPDMLAPVVPDVPTLAAPEALAPAPMTAPDVLAPAVPVVPPLVPPAPVTAALIEPDPLAPPDLLAPTVPAIPPLTAPSPVTAALTAPDAMTLDPPLLLPPAAPAVPALTAPDAPTVPPLLAPAPVTAALTAPDALTLDPLAAPGIDPLAAPAVPPLVPPDALALDPLTAPDFAAPAVPPITPQVVVPSFALPNAPAGPDVSPGAPGSVTGALTGENQTIIDGPTIELEAAIRAGIAAQQQLAHVTMQAVEEMRRERRSHDRPGGEADELPPPSDVLDFDVTADMLRSYV